jgi:CRISP-associated protein Cas1
MHNRIIEFAQSPAYLHTRGGLFVVESEEKGEMTVPIEELGCIIIAHPQCRITQSALAKLASGNVPVISCNEKYMPVGVMMPLHAHTTHTERLAAQSSASQPLKKQLWKQVVQCKVLAQARALEEWTGNDNGLHHLANDVRSGDPENIEAQAANRYWPTIFGDPDFRRNPDLDDQNKLLNYGYAILRAIITRAICGVGLHPALGIFHHNKYNPYCLADDLMEPYRPLIDKQVASIIVKEGDTIDLLPHIKQRLIATASGRYDFHGEQRTMFDIAVQTSRSLATAIMGGEKKLIFAEL